VSIDVGDTRVSALLMSAPTPKACFVLAHGAGAGMLHPFMATLASDLAARQIATLRYQFPYMEKRSRRPDPPALCHATVRAAVAAAHALLPALPLIAGGKSFGGRMTSQAQAANPLPTFMAWPSWDFLCIPRRNLPISGLSIFPRSRSRCCFFKVHAMNSRKAHC